jgi:uncharacterized repeat protein (TIGR01451 family)
MKRLHLKPTFAVCASVLLLGIICHTLHDGPSNPQTLNPAEPTSAAAARPAALDPQAVTGEEAVTLLKQRGWYDSLAEAMQAAQTRVEPVTQTAAAPVEQAAWHVSNPWRGFRAWFAADAVHVLPQNPQADWHWTARLSGYGHGTTLETPAPAEPCADDNRVEYPRGPITEWYNHQARGLEQGFTLAEAPSTAGRGLLTVTVSVETGLTPRLNDTADAIAYVTPDGQPVLHYAGLKAWDATGRDLPAHMELRDTQIALLVNDAGAVYPVMIDPLIFTETKLVASDLAPGDFFGSSVGISGDTVVVGAAFADAAMVSRAGAAYVFVRDPVGNWTEQAKLTASDKAALDQFGRSVGISGDTVVVGAHEADPDMVDAAGAAYVFVRDEMGMWTEQAKLTASDRAEGDEFGGSVGISGDTVVVGAAWASPEGLLNAGAAYVFVRDEMGMWSEQAKLTASDKAAGDLFGLSVGISGDTVVAGAPNANPDMVADAGAAYVFVRDAVGNWTEQAKLTAFDKAVGDVFGGSVGISGDTVVVGAPGADPDMLNAAGSAYVFVRDEMGMWTTQAKLTASDKAASDLFGDSVGISGDTVVVGAPLADPDMLANAGAAYVFVRDGVLWTEQVKLTASDKAVDDRFGNAVGINAPTVVVGAVFADPNGLTSAGAAYVYDDVVVTPTEADLMVSLGANKTSVRKGEELTYTITVQNFGPDSAHNVRVHDTLSSGTTFVSVTATKGAFTTPPVGQTGVVTWHIGDMLAGDREDAQLVVTVIVRGRTTITNTATVESDTDDPNLANNTASITTTVQAGSSGGGKGKKK